ncbi:hypothetical protein K7X08_019806 [Anisodus acutangulus]|uniref:Ribosomal protein S6 n=1 Tax=Anisodus acutangulus TaxID=402998 RepID=A0A9Q1RMB9_9SOLA|nr:hypothetical protein K7X08_019806 [Anisodus acutangulus]
MDLVAKVGKHVYRKNGVLTDLKSFCTVQLGYGIKKLNGRYYQGQLMQMIMMTPPSFNNELHYLNKEDRLLRWLLVKHLDIKFELDFLGEDDGKAELSKFRSNIYESEEEDDEDEYNVDES